MRRIKNRPGTPIPSHYKPEPRLIPRSIPRTESAILPICFGSSFKWLLAQEYNSESISLSGSPYSAGRFVQNLMRFRDSSQKTLLSPAFLNRHKLKEMASRLISFRADQTYGSFLDLIRISAADGIQIPPRFIALIRSKNPDSRFEHAFGVSFESGKYEIYDINFKKFSSNSALEFKTALENLLQHHTSQVDPESNCEMQFVWYKKHPS